MIPACLFIALSLPSIGLARRVQSKLDLDTDARVDSDVRDNSSAKVRLSTPAFGAARDWIEYAFEPDANAASFLRGRQRIFDFGEDDVDAIYLSSSDVEFISHSSLQETSHELSMHAGLEASMPFFSASVQTSVESTSHSSHRQMVVIYRARSSVAQVTVTALDLASKLRPEVRRFMERNSASRIVRRLGSLYAYEMTLGGIVRTKFQSTQSASDSMRSFSADVRANARAWIASVGVSAGVRSRSGSSRTSEDVHIKVDAQGGDTTEWLAGGDYREMQRAWTRTFHENGDNLYPIAYRLAPLWEIIGYVNEQKGREVENYIRAQWARDEAALRRLDVMPLAGPTNNWEQRCSAGHNIRIAGGTNHGETFLSTTGDGRLVDLYSRDDASGRQRWVLESIGNNQYNIRIASGTSHGRVYLSCTREGRVDLYHRDDASGRQRWIIEQRGSSNQVLIRVAGGTNSGETYLSTTREGRVDLYSRDDASGRQRWIIDECKR